MMAQIMKIQYSQGRCHWCVFRAMLGRMLGSEVLWNGQNRSRRKKGALMRGSKKVTSCLQCQSVLKSGGGLCWTKVIEAQSSSFGGWPSRCVT